MRMSVHLNLQDNDQETLKSQGKVRVTDLLSRLNEEKKIEKKRNLALGVAAVSAVTVFGIILTCLLYTSPSPRDVEESRMPSSA